jgi:tetratricopeptide (TPR) repeat protein
MAENQASLVPEPTAEQHRVAAAQFERAKEVFKSGNYDYAIQLLLTCCKLEPNRLLFRQALRRTEKIKFKDNLHGSRLAFLANPAAKTRLKGAKAARDHLRVLEVGEEILTRNPWDVGTQMDMSEAADALGLTETAVWILEQAREKDPMDPTVNRTLARLCEKAGLFKEAIGLWELVRKKAPRDLEAQRKGKDLAASDTIARGNYEALVQPKAGAPASNGAAVGRLPFKPAASIDESAGPSIREPREAANLRARIEADPTNPATYLHLASVYRRNDLIEKARQVLEDGLGPTSNHFEISIELAALDIEPFRRNLAITEERLQANPGDDGLLRIRRQLLREINSREMDLYRQKAERFPTEAANRLEFGLRLLRAGQIDAAIAELQSARSDPRQRWRAFLYLGYCFKERNNWRLAQRNFEEALQMLPAGEEATRKELMFVLANGAAQGGDFTTAIELGCELAHIDFGYRDIGRLVDEWQAKANKA